MSYKVEDIREYHKNCSPSSGCVSHGDIQILLCEITALQSQLDAIKKVAEPIQNEYSLNLEMGRTHFAGIPMKTLKEFVEALDKLIGGGK